MALEKHQYFLTKGDLAKLDRGESVDIISKQNVHIQLLLDEDEEVELSHRVMKYGCGM